MDTKMTKIDDGATKGKGLVTTELAQLYKDNAGVGHDDLGREDYALPFLKILQGLSPEIQRGDPKFIPGAKQGDLVNSVTGETYDGEHGVRVVRVAFEKKYIEWRPRKAGGGLVKIFDTFDAALSDRIPPIGNADTDTEIIETAQVFCLVETAAGWQPAVMSLTKSKLKASRAWNALMAEQTYQKWGIPGDPNEALPHAAMIYRVRTVSKTNPKGTFFVPVVDRAEVVPTPAVVFGRAMEFRKVVRAGRVKVKLERDEDLDAVPGDDKARGY